MVSDGFGRLVLCRPRGGLNDMLSQIEKCCRYAEQAQRAVVVEVHTGSHPGFGDDLDRYFISRQRLLRLETRGLTERLASATVFPPFVAKRLYSYKAIQVKQLRLRCEIESRQPVTFDFAKHYTEEVVLHEQAGRLPYSSAAFLRMQLRAPLVDELQVRLRQVGHPYVGVHVRHTDYQSDYVKVIELVRTTKAKQIFLATDNGRVLDEFRSQLPDRRIFSFTGELSKDGSPIHLQPMDDARTFARSKDAILDLLMLALSRQLLIAGLLPNRLDFKRSGYSQLAADLWSQKRIVSSLVGEAVRAGLD